MFGIKLKLKNEIQLDYFYKGVADVTVTDVTYRIINMFKFVQLNRNKNHFASATNAFICQNSSETDVTL